jgi:hypothetical protein
MSKMKIPGFTAEVSLYKTSEHYQRFGNQHQTDRNIHPSDSDGSGLGFWWEPYTGGQFDDLSFTNLDKGLQFYLARRNKRCCERDENGKCTIWAYGGQACP